MQKQVNGLHVLNHQSYGMAVEQVLHNTLIVDIILNAFFLLAKLCASELFNDVAKKNMIAKGACDFADMYAPGHCVNISCTYKGYLIDGNQTYTLQCQADGNWTRNMTALQCERQFLIDVAYSGYIYSYITIQFLYVL